MIFNVNFKTLSSLIRIHLLVNELYKYQNAQNNDKNMREMNYWFLLLLVLVCCCCGCYIPNSYIAATRKYEGESNENLKYFVLRHLLNTKVHNDFIFLCNLHCALFHSLFRSDFPSRWLQLLQWPLVSLLGVPDRVEESLLQN